MFASLLLTTAFAILANGPMKLAADTELRLSGSETKAVFKGGTTVQIDGTRGVAQGILAKTQAFEISGLTRRIEFQAGTSASFTKGQVTTGTLTHDESLAINGLADPPKTFKAGTVVAFNPRGQVTSGTLSKNQKLFINGMAGAPNEFLGGTSVTINPQGQVTRGTLGADQKFMPAGSVNADMLLKKGTHILVDSTGHITQAILGAETKLRVEGAPGAMKSFPAGATVTFKNGFAK